MEKSVPKPRDQTNNLWITDVVLYSLGEAGGPSLGTDKNKEYISFCNNYKRVSPS